MKNLEVKYIKKGQYLFKQKDKGDCAYLILHGSVIFLAIEKIYLDDEDQKDDDIQLELRDKESKLTSADYVRMFNNKFPEANPNDDQVELETVVKEFE